MSLVAVLSRRRLRVALQAAAVLVLVMMLASAFLDLSCRSEGLQQRGHESPGLIGALCDSGLFGLANLGSGSGSAADARMRAGAGLFGLRQDQDPAAAPGARRGDPEDGTGPAGDSDEAMLLRHPTVSASKRRLRHDTDSIHGKRDSRRRKAAEQAGIAGNANNNVNGHGDPTSPARGKPARKNSVDFQMPAAAAARPHPSAGAGNPAAPAAVAEEEMVQDPQPAPSATPSISALPSPVSVPFQLPSTMPSWVPSQWRLPASLPPMLRPALPTPTAAPAEPTAAPIQPTFEREDYSSFGVFAKSFKKMHPERADEIDRLMSAESADDLLQDHKFFNEAEQNASLVLQYGRRAPLHHYDARFFQRLLTPEETHANLLEVFRAWGRFADEHGFQYWLAHGTLIGWHWGQKILPWDHDIDIQMNANSIMLLPNNTVIADRYLISVNPHVFIRTHQRDNVIDARIIDKETGIFIDITGLAMVPESFPGVPRPAKPTGRHANDAPFTYMEMREAIAAYDREMDVYHAAVSRAFLATSWDKASVTPESRVTCKSPHYLKIGHIYPLVRTMFAGIPTWRPHDHASILVDEYGLKVLTNDRFGRYRFDGALQEFVMV